jgi:hypothetical protein
MSLHKLTAGSGYDYLTRQVAALDATDKGRTGLASYYTERGESPGVWVGSGMAGIDGLDVGDPVTAEQMRALFGCGLHPLAELRLKQLDGPDFTGRDFRDVMRLGHRSRSSTMRRRSGLRWLGGSLLLMRRSGSRSTPRSRRLTGRGFGRRWPGRGWVHPPRQPRRRPGSAHPCRGGEQSADPRWALAVDRRPGVVQGEGGRVEGLQHRP